MTTRDRVREALLAASDAPVSGEELASGLGVSRAAVAKHVAALRKEGAAIEAAAGSGYRLDRSRSTLPELVAEHLPTELRGHLHGGGPTASTMDDARALARNGAPDGTVVLASEQRQGRGRLGRVWSSPRGGAYLSMVVRPSFGTDRASAAPLAVSLAIAEALDERGVRASLKWPNDLVVPGSGKLGGVLLEGSVEGTGLAWLLVGVGVNVFAPESPTDAAAYARHVAPRVSIADVAAAVITGAHDGLDQLAAEGFEPMRGRYQARMVWIGERVTVSDAASAVLAEGTARGVDSSGRLRVAQADGEEFLATVGDVSLRSHP